jgi:hypothetical protein
VLLAGVLVSVCVFVFVFEALAPNEDADDGASSSSASPSPSSNAHAPSNPLGVRLADLLRAQLGIDELIESHADAGDDDDDDDDSVDADVDEDSDDDAAAWRTLPDAVLVNEPDRMLSTVFSWTTDDLVRWLRLLGTDETLVLHVQTLLAARNMSALEFVAKRRDSLDDLLAGADARGVQSIAVGNAMVRAFARQAIALEQAVDLLASDGSALDFLGDDLAAVLVSAAHFLFRTVAFFVKLLVAMMALLFFGPEGVGLTLLRWLLRALVWLMGILTPIIQRVFPRFRFRVLEQNL